MKKPLLSALVVMIVLIQFGAASAKDDAYQPVEASPETHASYIESITQQDGKITLVADYIQWFEGEEANEQFRLHEQDPEMTEAPDGYYIVNEDETLTELEVAADAEVYMQIYNRTGVIEEADIIWNEQIDVETFVALIQDNEEWDLRDFPYHLTVKDDKIIKIVQQYIP
ncbi:hypothetical protein [Paenibacillus daejeonensis]|uniref:hypothetical protein n=1 Tax=Paenibacillus daejeonensis TaxID=135193 RepID=UPI00037AF0D6|nr:hypothetical protein [Paenibacillus daejeonensis]